MADAIPAKRNHNFQDLTGQRFGKLVVLAYAGRTERGNSLWRCECDCGEMCVTETKMLRIGKTKSCGCLGRANLFLGHTPRQVIDPSGTIALAGGHVCLVDQADIHIISGYNWYAHRNRVGCYYARAVIPKTTGKQVLMHVLLMGRKGIDHINGNGLDNRRSNLRFATISENCHNSRKQRTSRNRFKGVVRPRLNNRLYYWQANITINGKQVRFGKFATEEEAARAYDVKAKEIYGEFARLNFPGEQ